MDGLIGRILTEIEERKDEMKMTGQISFRLVPVEASQEPVWLETRFAQLVQALEERPDETRIESI